MTLVEARRLSSPSLKAKIANYIITRQNEDGGYCFAQGALESNGQDTYYGLAILNELDESFPNVEKTLEFLDENRVDSIYSLYYVAKSQILLGKKISEEIAFDIKQTLDTKKYFGSRIFFSDASEFSSTLMALELANLLKINVSLPEIVAWLLSFENEDGGFGQSGYSNIDSTYHAVASLRLLGENPKRSAQTLRFVRSCEKPFGGFTVIPMNLTPYMEHTYYGVMTLDLLDQENLHFDQTINWVLSCQNSTGGFARSDLGISTFVDTYYAIKLLQKLDQYREG